MLLGFCVFIIPLLLLLWFQYIWLGKLERTSAIAQQVTLRSNLEMIAKEVTLFYRSKANQLLKIPRDYFLSEDTTKIAKHWEGADLEGIRRIYVVKYSEVATGNYYTYRPDEKRLVSATASDESLAVIIACLPWQAWVHGAVPVQSTDFQVNEQDLNHRLILNPIVDELKKIIAVAVIVLDETYFREKLLKGATERALDCICFGQKDSDPFVTVRNKANELVYGKTPPADSVPNASIQFPFVFRDWSLSLYSKGLSPEQWARKSFIYNMALAIVLSVVVLGGIMLALRAATKAMRLSEMKSDFVSNVSHELRTPLASIRVFAEFLRLKKVSDSDKVSEYGEYIELETQRLTRLIDNILDFSRIETERKIYNFAPTDLVDLVESVLNSFSLRLKQSGFALNAELPQAPLPQADVDPDALGQALHNLLDNAIKYSKQNKEIAVNLFTENGNYVISVRDRGIGINKKEQGRIFDRFHRVSTGLVHDIKGSGLGLAIVYHIMRAHGGTVKVESEIGKGSTFFLLLPMKSRSEGGHESPSETA